MAPETRRIRPAPQDMTFRVHATEGAARAGVLTTSRGDIRTPAFMPVGTKGTVKSLHPDEVRALGADVVLGNTYHLHFRPGEDVVEQLGGIHAFSGWSGPILTDSGGFQVFSLRDTIAALDDDGVTFRSVYDGAEARFTPERAAEMQRRLGSDVAMCLDVCLPAGASRHELERAARITTAWAGRQADAPRAAGQLRFGIAQGGTERDLRTASIEEITALPFDGFALGGLAVGESKAEMFDCRRVGGAHASGGSAALLHGNRRSRGHPRGRRARHRHVRLRASDADGENGVGPHLGRAHQPPERDVPD